jgi:hypothetical protein
MITLADPPVAAADVGDSLVGCARSKGVAVLPQKCSDAATCVPVDPGTGMSFYGKATTAIGTWKKCDAARGTAGVEYSCSKTITKTNNKTGAWTKLDGTAAMTDALIYNLSVSAGGIGSLNATEMTLINADLDILLHAHYQLNDGTACDKNQRLVVTATDQDVSFPAGMKAQNKCTIILEAAAKYGPGFKFTAHGYNDFTLGWVEFSEDALTTAGQMPATDASKLFTGKYPSASGPFLNMITTADVGSAATKFAKSD